MRSVLYVLDELRIVHVGSKGFSSTARRYALCPSLPPRTAANVSPVTYQQFGHDSLEDGND
jgi:hypothetical protein